MPDKKALKILFATYWGGGGWKSTRTTPKDDLAYAIAAGVMFPPRDLQHDDVNQEIVKLREAIPPQAVGDAFVASLSTRRVDLRSALGTYAVARHLPPHKFTKSKHLQGDVCGICGDPGKVQRKEDLNVLNFERFKWGGVRHLHPYYIAFDLARFLETPPAAPTAEDHGMLRGILDAARQAEPKTSPGKLEKQIAGIFPADKNERSNLLQILGLAGVLQPRNRPGFFASYVKRDELEESSNDWQYPVCWWRGSDGVDESAVSFWFPGLARQETSRRRSAAR
jgi:hypothetical protein